LKFACLFKKEIKDVDPHLPAPIIMVKVFIYYSGGKITASSMYIQNNKLPVKKAPTTKTSLTSVASIFNQSANPEQTPKNILLYLFFVSFAIFCLSKNAFVIFFPGFIDNAFGSTLISFSVLAHL
jgi:hypothetical protein